MSNEIDFSFISSLEGGQRVNGYVPAVAVSNSGVTIATGFDLGARSGADLNNLNFPPELIAKLKPYLGLKKQAAVTALQNAPLTISKEEADSIDKAAKHEATEVLIHRYDSAVAPGRLTFSQLPKQAQTVIASVAYQYGDLAKRTPRFWKTVTEQRWADAVAELKKFGDQYPTRRNKEAALLLSIVNPAPATP